MITIEHVGKVFGRSASQALAARARGEDRDAIHQRTGCFIALEDVSFTVREGEIFVLMGLSGSGKSTLLRCINGLVRPDLGRVILTHEGREVDLARADP